MILEARGVSARYPGSARLVLDAVDIRVAAGELVAVVGPNGSGKTSLTRALLGTIPPVGGTVLLDGVSIREWDRRALARAVGVVAQREETPFPIRVAEAVMMGRYARLGPLETPRPEDHAVVRQALERCDVWEFRQRPVDTLSGGEWQRVRMARALAQGPGLLVLDEPSAALDIGHEMQQFELISDLVAAGIGALVVSHHLNVAARFATSLVLLSTGRIAAHGAAGDVLRPDILGDVFGWPVSVSVAPDGRPQVLPLRQGRSGR
ncbi:MAG TPA: ABC transporter ATP-binding protein [Gemmatimonadales bacterium]|nr:ABC transporter ATP-binding protein [Gemmatimonadales bacterium]